MVYPASRSMNHDLEEGMSDGKYKKIVQNRGGIVEKQLAYDTREDLCDVYYGIHEDNEKHLPDGTVDPQSSLYVVNKEPQIGV
jgi:hypothetical protein